MVSVVMKFTILHRHTKDRWHVPGYDISRGNRILDEGFDGRAKTTPAQAGHDNRLSDSGE